MLNFMSGLELKRIENYMGGGYRAFSTKDN